MAEDYVWWLEKRIEVTYCQVHNNMLCVSDRMDKTLWRQKEKGGYVTGDLVWLYNPRRRRGYLTKL